MISILTEHESDRASHIKWVLILDRNISPILLISVSGIFTH